MRTSILSLLACLLLSSPILAQNAPALTITGVAANTDSVKVRYSPVSGAADYRVYDAANPSHVKYAGLWHLLAPSGYRFQGGVLKAGSLGTTFADVPATEIEMNGLLPGHAYTLIVEAVDAVGPVPSSSLYDSHNAPLQLSPMVMPGMAASMLGSNMGMTSDGKTSTNGQGAVGNNPHVITSASVVVTPTGKPALPSSPAATQILFDTFDSGAIAAVGKPDPRSGIEQFVMATSSASWEIRTENIDTANTSVFLMGKHFMDVLFDGGTPGSGNPMHNGWGTVSLSPTTTADFSGGQILHITQEVDGHLGNRRWVDLRLTPADDPYLFFHTDHRINRTNTDLMLEIFGGNVVLTQHTGNRDSTANSAPIGAQIVGAPGQGKFTDCARPGLTASGAFVSNPQWQGKQPVAYQQGRGLDNRSRFDLFVSQTHVAVYEDGVKISEHDLPTPLPFSVAKVYFSHYHYHSALEVQELGKYNAWETLWINTFQFSDERHWDNTGYEVLPAGTSWAALGATVQPPAFH